MKLEYRGPVVPNGPGASLYLGEGFLDHPSFPFDPGSDEFRALVATDAPLVVLAPADADLEFPLRPTVYDPASYRLTIDDPDTMIHETPDPDRSNPGGDADR